DRSWEGDAGGCGRGAGGAAGGHAARLGQVAGFATRRAPTRRRASLKLRPQQETSVTVLESQLNPRSAEFQANAAAMQALVTDLDAQVALHAAGGGEAARRKHESRGKLPPRER